MPGFYPEDEYDLAGFSVGVADRAKLFDNSKIVSGDVIIALPSSGVHSNGFSLVRKAFNIDSDPSVLKKYSGELGCTLGEALLMPTKIYVKPVLALKEQVTIKGISHITGGGFYENIPRSLPEGISAKIDKAALRTPALFGLLQSAGDIPERDMFNTFNMGVGMCITVSRGEAERALRVLRANGETDAYILGETVSGDEGVII